MHSKSENIETIINDKAVEVIDRIFKSFFSKNGICLETTIKGCYFNFYCIDLLHYKCHQTNLNCVDHTHVLTIR